MRVEYDATADVIMLEVSEENRVPTQTIEQNKMSKVLEMMFGVEGFKLCPPPLFSIGLIVTNVSIFIHHLVTFMEEGWNITLDWGSGPPWPECSILIYNTFLRHQVLFASFYTVKPFHFKDLALL